ncbi:centromere protein X [Marchantia polymorpha subsp. ruderalis]|uniref:Centromere protein X n=2 Tax=Marchantia polymorpha TaxID=3197 RepID=A0AAF6BL16_MARPO|nr:hypothetical protein MARPO_0166s0013 [Marchantia polymorpha]BBN12700.1 hypothetical protein Mp_5g22190 [Marchantia polymorpha subsp. ruderalis]|eukprot:PTQ28356.1 hypothetical protein MARPO_0166s0013 [Marchantia polymorpha]
MHQTLFQLKVKSWKLCERLQIYQLLLWIVFTHAGTDIIPKEETEDTENVEDDSLVILGANAAAGPSRKPRSTTANANALKLTCELLKLFVSETVQRAAMVAEAEGSTEIDGSHLERILPQLLLDF